MENYQVSNIAAHWKVAEEVVMVIVEHFGGLEKAPFKKVDGYFKDLDWKQRKAKWNRFKGISIKYSNKKFVVGGKLYERMKKFFDQDVIQYPPGWEGALSINNHYVTFCPCRVFGSKSCDSVKWYMYVKVHGTREQMTSGTMDFDNNRVFLVPYDRITKLGTENDKSRLRFTEYLDQMADSAFTQGEAKAWKKEGKLRYYTGNIAKKGW